MSLFIPLAIADLRWYRLPVTLLNTHVSKEMKAHPVSVFEAVVKSATSLVFPQTLNNEGPPYVFFHVRKRRHTFSIREGDTIHLDIFFCGCAMQDADMWRDALGGRLADPMGGRNYALGEMGDVEERDFGVLAAEAGVSKIEGEICLEFLSPVPFKTGKGRQTWLDTAAFVRLFEGRLTRLFGRKIIYEAGEDNFQVLPYYWNYTEVGHTSGSQPGQVQHIKGCTGNLYIKGAFRNFLPFLILGSELHAGAKISNSQGYYLLHERSLPYFDKCFPARKAMVSVIRDILDRYDTAAESLSLSEKMSFREEDLAERLVREISDGAWRPSPATAFLVRKKDGSERMVEQASFRDMIVQTCLLKTISGIFDRMFEESSIGFRKGMSRDTAVEMVKNALAEGYRYVIESDIEDFFPSVDLAVLTRLLESCLPEKDVCVKDVLAKILRNGCVLNGAYQERGKGLAQGSPLSPLLSNLYLDSFDERVGEWGVRMVRYADDFIMLTRSREEAEGILCRAETCLSDIGLKINIDKTAIRPVEDGFQFLGIRFDGSEVIVEPEEELKKLRKPLYITEPYAFLSLNGDAVDIRRDGRIIETIPMRRISEIMVMERTVFSTALIRRCTDRGIPLTITLNSGYYITTIKPDSKNYYDISFEHGRRYRSMSDTEILCIAREFAAGKVRNYISLFRQRYEKGDNIFIHELERTMQKMNHAADVCQLRGLEGAAAKKIYSRLNGSIDHGVFHIRKRERRNPDRINSLLNFGYYLLFSRANATVRAAGLNPYLGFLHDPADNYESLVCDIEELFRSRIDRFIIRLVNQRVITENDFVETDCGMYLAREASKRFLEQFEKEMDGKAGKDRLSLKDNIHAQVEIFRRWATEGASLSFYEWHV